MYKLFGREPALWLALLYSAVVLSTTFGLSLSVESQGAINAGGAALFGLLTAWAVARDGLHAAILGFAKAIIALAVSFGLQWAPEAQLGVMAFLTAAVSMFVRNNATAPVNEAGGLVAERSVLGEGVASIDRSTDRTADRLSQGGIDREVAR